MRHISTVKKHILLLPDYYFGYEEYRAFFASIFQSLNPEVQACQTIILFPNREAAIGIMKIINNLLKYTSLR